jgi:hypothetical protein
MILGMIVLFYENEKYWSPNHKEFSFNLNLEKKFEILDKYIK